MNEQINAAKPVSPRAVLTEIVEAIPEDCKKNMIIIGSLAVGYHFFAENGNMVVRTKDADSLLSPRIEAVHAGEEITEELMNSGWEFSNAGVWGQAGTSQTPLNELSAIRLHPPGKNEWFLELLTVPENSSERDKRWQRLHTKHGDFGLPSFGFLSITNYEPIETELGIKIAKPELMALANMLEHPAIKPDTMSGLIENRSVKRSNKDLGRVLAIAYLSTVQDPDSLETWPEIWGRALQHRFPIDWQQLAQNCGAGIRALLESELDLDEAYHTCRYGLLASEPPELEQLRIAGERLLMDAVEVLEEMGI